MRYILWTATFEIYVLYSCIDVYHVLFMQLYEKAFLRNRLSFIKATAFHNNKKKQIGTLHRISDSKFIQDFYRRTQKSEVGYRLYISYKWLLKI